MPRKPKHPCAYPGCPKLTYNYYCDEHNKKYNKDFNKHRRDPDYSKRYGHKWKKIRDRYVKENPLCEMCLRNGRYVPVEEVHHIIPLSQGGTNSTDNLMSLCRSCHTKIHMELGDRKPRK